MKINVKKIFVLGLIIFLLIQFYQPARNVSSEQDMTEDFTNVYTVPKNVATILRTSCYDCHSNNTEYPWYSYIQPVRMFMDNHIKEGKENLNFSEFGNYSERKQGNKLEEIVKQIKADEMPLASYTLIYRNAVLSTTQKEEVIIGSMQQKIVYQGVFKKQYSLCTKIPNIQWYEITGKSLI